MDAPSAIAARGYPSKFKFLPGKPGYVTVGGYYTVFSQIYNCSSYQPTAIDDPKRVVELYRTAAINAKEAGFDGVERESLIINS